VVTKGGKIALIKRGNDPFKGFYALPGGFVSYGEKLEQGVLREVQEETGLKTEIVDLIGVYSAPGRDPRGHFVTAVYHLRPISGSLRAGDDAQSAEWIPLDKLPRMAFDHSQIISDFLKRTKRNKS
jgi:8-oxo-dGTP diphosphatase